MENVELTAIKQEALYPESSKPGDSDRCLKKGVRSSMQMSSNWELVVQGGKTALYQCRGTSNNKTSFVDIHQVRINQINSLPNRHENSNFLSIENGGHIKSNNDSSIKRDQGSFVEKEHNSSSRIPSQCSKQGDRLGVTKQQGLRGLKTVSSNLSKNQVSVCSSPNRSVCITSMRSSRKLSFLKTRHSKRVDAM